MSYAVKSNASLIWENICLWIRFILLILIIILSQSTCFLIVVGWTHELISHVLLVWLVTLFFLLIERYTFCRIHCNWSFTAVMLILLWAEYLLRQSAFCLAGWPLAPITSTLPHLFLSVATIKAVFRHSLIRTNFFHMNLVWYFFSRS